jgi:hypothetical protein
MRARWAWAACAVAFAALPSCSKSSGSPKALNMSGTRMVPGGPPVDPAAEPPADFPTAPGHDPVEGDGAPLYYTVTEKLEAGAPPKVDPDLAILAAARVEASECFNRTSGGPDVRSAVIRVTVLSAGNVSRVEVSSDPDVFDCLHRVGDGLHFTQKDDAPAGKTSPRGADNGGAGIRSFSIDVSVTRNH